MGKSKYYVVWQGHKPGIYSDWETTKQQVDQFEGAKYKSFESKQEAEQAYKSGFTSNLSATNTSSKKNDHIISNSVCVDAACSGNPGVMEYRCVETISKREIFKMGPFPEGTNNIGEFLGLVHILALLDKKQRYDVTVYTDSITAMAWVRNKKAKTNLERNSKNSELLDTMHRAEQWLKEHQVKNPILKWETTIWGEIPADFGRK